MSERTWQQVVDGENDTAMSKLIRFSPEDDLQLIAGSLDSVGIPGGYASQAPRLRLLIERLAKLETQQWTSKHPTVEGYYWEWEPNDNPSIVEFRTDCYGDLRHYDNGGVYSSYSNEHPNMRWSGPIVAPSEPIESKGKS